MSLLLLLAIVIGIGMYYINAHPVFFVPSIMIILFVIIMAAVFSNVFEEITAVDDLIGVSSEFTLMPFVMANYVKFILFFCFMIVILMYAKAKITI